MIHYKKPSFGGDLNVGFFLLRVLPYGIVNIDVISQKVVYLCFKRFS